MSRLRYVSGASVRVARPPGSAHTRVELDDRCVPAAVFKRIFPLSVTANYFSVLASDGQEVAIIRDVDAIDPESRKIIDEELDRRYFTPTIEQIELLKQEAGMWHFKAQTHRGPADFYVRNWRDSAHEIAPGRWQILSVDGARFEIKDLERLDERSRRFLDQLL